MNHEQAAHRLTELGHTTRLAIYRLLVKAGVKGLEVNEIKQQLNIPGSTLSHHISHLIKANLVKQKRSGRVLYCHAHFESLQELIDYLLEECCIEDRSK